MTSTFRGGAERNGKSEEIFETLDLKPEILLHDLNIGVHSASKASPAVDDSGIYVGSDGGWIYALDLNGKIRWRYFAADSLRGIHSTAVLDETTAYFATYAGDVMAFEKETGELRWIIRVGETVGASPILFQDSLLVTVETNEIRDGFVIRLNRRTGEIIWKSPYLGEQSHSSPTLDSENKIIYVGTNNSRVYAVEFETGSPFWFIDTHQPVKSTGAWDKGNLYYSTWAHQLLKIDGRTGAIIWSTDLLGKSQGSPALVPEESRVIVSSGAGFIFGIDSQNGKIIWTSKTYTTKSRYPSATAVRWRQSKNSLRWIAWISCGDKDLCAFDVKSGQLLKKFELPGELSGEVVIYRGALYIALNESHLLRLVPRKL